MYTHISAAFRFVGAALFVGFVGAADGFFMGEAFVCYFLMNC